MPTWQVLFSRSKHSDGGLLGGVLLYRRIKYWHSTRMSRWHLLAIYRSEIERRMPCMPLGTLLFWRFFDLYELPIWYLWTAAWAKFEFRNRLNH